MNPARLLLCTDLDRTLLPNGTQPESPQARSHFAALAARAEVDLVYITGRDRGRVWQAINEYDIPRPDYLIADVGSCIYQDFAKHGPALPAWQEQIAPDWQGLRGAELRNLLHDIVALQAQEDSKQSDFKLSYYVPLDTDKKTLLATVETRLQQHSIRANLIWSIDEPAGIGLLDILPRSATKYHALVFLMHQTEHNPANTLFAGDSGNDLDLLGSEIPSVLVANASPEVMREARDLAAARGNTQQLYIAQGGMFGMNGNYSAGIVEGLVYFYPQLRGWLDWSPET